MATQILALRQPLYDLNNAENWMLQVAAQIGIDKQLPREALTPVGDIAHFLAKRRWCRECGAAL